MISDVAQRVKKAGMKEEEKYLHLKTKYCNECRNADHDCWGAVFLLKDYKYCWMSGKQELVPLLLPEMLEKHSKHAFTAITTAIQDTSAFTFVA